MSDQADDILFLRTKDAVYTTREQNTVACVVCGDADRDVLKSEQAIGPVCDKCLWYQNDDGTIRWVSWKDA